MENYIRKVIDRYLRNRYPEEIDREFRTWLSDEEFAEEKDSELYRLWLDTDASSTPDFHRSLEHMREFTGFNTHRQVHRLRTRLIYWRVAAVLILALSGISVYLSVQSKAEPDLLQAYIPVAQLRSLTLPDGTEVMLNAQSTLIYPSRFTGDTRSVYLTGEANFKVKRNEEQPFVVKSEGVQVTALGTEFNVSAYPHNDVVSTTLLSGKVSVACQGTDSIGILMPSQQLVYHKHRHTIAYFTPDLRDVTAWQRGELVFNDMTVLEIITVLKRKYHYDFIYSLSDLKSDRFCFRFRENAPLKEVMDMMTDVAGNLSFEIEGDKCYIHGHS